jgi:hypothetical protein
MPELIKLYIRSAIMGFGLAALFVAILLALDVAHLRHLVLGSDMAFVAVGMLWFLNGIVFAGVQFGWAVMQLAEDSSGGRGASLLPKLRKTSPIPVESVKK